MSLLLDALKKAADEKKKGDDKIQDELTDQSLVDEVDLNLELEEEVSEEFPQVNKEIVKPISEVEEKNFITDSKLKDNNVVESTDVIDESDLAIQDDSGEKELIESATQNSIQNKQKDVEVKSVDAHLPDRQVEIQNEKALSALINKGNQAGQQSRSKTRRLTVAIIILLVLIVTGYFYLQVSDSIQSVQEATGITDSVDNKEIHQPIAQTATESINPDLAEELIDHVEKPVVAESNVRKVSTTKQAKAKTNKAMPKSKITIIHKQVDDPIDVLIRRAYAAFNQDQLEQAESIYKQVIDRDSKNRDALLGLAAIAVKKQQFEYARQKYTELLKLNPKDSFARAGLSSVESQQNARFNESRLKMMISDEPGAAHLYFALGNLYAAENRWPEAQTAYFSAWSADNTNGDYAYNLAVSLDHLGKLNNAKDFYSLSLKLQQASGGNVPIEVIKSRISSIESASHE